MDNILELLRRGLLDEFVKDLDTKIEEYFNEKAGCMLHADSLPEYDPLCCGHPLIILKQPEFIKELETTCPMLGMATHQPKKC